MAVDIHKLIAAISPETFCEKWKEEDGKRIDLHKKIREVIKEKGYLEAANLAKPLESSAVKPDEYDYASPLDANGTKDPVEKHEIAYDASNENLEPIYFWLVDYLTTEYKKSKSVEKLIDNFASTAGSYHFSEMGGKATKMQEEAMKMLGAANQLIKSIITLLYDLKEFKTRLSLYKKAKSDNPGDQQSGILSLKQIWLDTVDLKRGNSSIKQMAAQYQYVTLIDAFFAADSVEKVKVYSTKAESDKAGSLDLNDRVKRILEQRLGEFFEWVKLSEEELTKRYNIEKIYLRSQVNSVRLYSHWVKPYLRAAKNLEQRAQIDNPLNASLVSAFNTSIFELTLLAKGEYDLKGDISSATLPAMFEKAKKRNYSAIMVVELSFRTIPGKLGNNQSYTFRGRLNAKFTSYALNDDELKILKTQIEKDDLKDVVGLIEGATDDSLNILTKEIDEYLNEDKKNEDEDEKKKENEKKKTEDVNPFSALFGELFTGWFKKPEDEKVDISKGIPKDNEIEKILRSQAIIQARGECSKMYSSFKKAQNMVA